MIPFGEFTTEIPSANVEAMQTDENGYEWFTSQDGTNFYRTIDSQTEWMELEVDSEP
jgi:streptogramin lyase